MALCNSLARIVDRAAVYDPEIYEALNQAFSYFPSPHFEVPGDRTSQSESDNNNQQRR